MMMMMMNMMIMMMMMMMIEYEDARGQLFTQLKTVACFVKKAPARCPAMGCQHTTGKSPRPHASWMTPSTSAPGYCGAPHPFVQRQVLCA